MLTVKNLTYSYSKTPVLQELSISFEIGKTHGIVGFNGAGKTTFFNVLTGVMQMQSGNIKSDDRALTNKNIGYLPAENHFYPYMKGKEYLQLFGDHAVIEKYNQLFMLPLDEFAEDYSTGMKKKLALMGVLLQDKPILVLDEPYNGLDLETCHILDMLLIQLKKANKTILISSHIMKTLTNVCDSIHYMEGGKIAQTIQPSEYSQFEESIESSIKQKQSETIEGLFS